MGTINVAIAGVGNCASSLVQGVEYYRNTGATDDVPGLMHPVLGGYGIGDVRFTAAFDVDQDKVGEDLAKAIGKGQNNTVAFCAVPTAGVEVQRGPTLDGIGRYLADVIVESPQAPVDVARVLRETDTQVLVSYLPVGSEQAARWYAEQALEAGCALVNCMPVFIAGNDSWAERFRRRGVPIVGDDIKSQVGATIVHRNLVRLFQDRGVRVDRTYQLNFGGNTDFLNMLERDRLESKKVSKTQAVTSQLETELAGSDVHVGPSDHVPWLADRKWCHIRIEGTTFGDVPLNRGVEAGGVGQPQLRRRGHRRHPLRPPGPRSGHRRPALRDVRLLHEVAAAPDARRGRPQGPRGVHRRFLTAARARGGVPLCSSMQAKSRRSPAPRPSPSVVRARR